MQSYFPIVIDLAGKPCLVVGGGDVATRKTEALLQAGGVVTVIAPEATPVLISLAETGKLTWRQEAFREQSTAAYFLVVAATNQPEVNLAVWQATREHNGWINIVDRPDLCNFIVPAVVQRGKMTISISTSGASPGLARKIKKQIETVIGPEYETYLDFLAATRKQVMAEVSDPQLRKAIFRQLLDQRFLDAGEQERYELAARLLEQLKQTDQNAGRQT